tara:strand:- start:119 stop:439 length:321 start_codon:yes stop_codon:yes gene_type:complete
MTYSQKANPNATNSEMDSKTIIKHPQLTNLQRNELIEQWVEIVVDGMDMKTLVSIVTENMVEYYEVCSDIELKEEIDNYEECLYDELVDNVTNETVLDVNNNGGKF